MAERNFSDALAHIQKILSANEALKKELHDQSESRIENAIILKPSQRLLLESILEREVDKQRALYRKAIDTASFLTKSDEDRDKIVKPSEMFLDELNTLYNVILGLHHE